MESKRQEFLSLLSTAEKLSHELKDELPDKIFRTMAQNQIKSVLANVQTPFDQFFDIIMPCHALPLARTAMDAGWLETTAQAASAGVTPQDLVKGKSHDPALAARIMRVLALSHVVQEVGVKTWAATPLTKLFLAWGTRDGVIHFSENIYRTAATYPAHFKHVNYQEPKDPLYSPYAFAHGKTMWEYQKDVPEIGIAFDNFMKGNSMVQQAWLENLPETKLRELFTVESPDSILFVDVGGGLGGNLDDVETFQRKLHLPGRLILEEQPEVVAKIDVAKKSWTPVAHDFYRPQPKGYEKAKIFYFQFIMHDWSDEHNARILAHIRDAMKPGYSKILVRDMVLPERDCPSFEANLDVAMFVMPGKERTKSEWEEMVELVPGLQIERFWPLDPEGTGNFDSIIEIGRTS